MESGSSSVPACRAAVTVPQHAACGKDTTPLSGTVNLSLHRPWRPLRLPEVWDPTFSDIRLTDGGKVVSPTRRPLFTARKIHGTHFCRRLSRPRAIVPLED
jgi:hypothetical protein